MRQSVVSYGGQDDGGAIFNLTFGFPDATPGEALVSKRPAQGVEQFYGFTLDPDATEFQAHALLTYRDYAKAVAQRLRPGAGRARTHVIARFVAGFISQDATIRDEVTRYMDQRFDEAADPDMLPAQVDQMRYFADAAEFLEALTLDMQDVGADL